MLVLIFAFAVQGNAQHCGSYMVSLEINRVDGKPVTNAVVQLLPIEKDETNKKGFVRNEKLPNFFWLTFFEKDKLFLKYKLIVFADGFKTFETEIGFPHCKKRHFVLNLEANIFDGKSSFEEMTIIIFTIEDSFNSSDEISDVETTAVGEDGKIYESKSVKNGQVFLQLISNKKYRVQFKKSGYKTKEINVDLSRKEILYEPVEIEKL